MLLTLEDFLHLSVLLDLFQKPFHEAGGLRLYLRCLLLFHEGCQRNWFQVCRLQQTPRKSNMSPWLLQFRIIKGLCFIVNNKTLGGCFLCKERRWRKTKTKSLKDRDKIKAAAKPQKLNCRQMSYVKLQLKTEYNKSCKWLQRFLLE